MNRQIVQTAVQNAQAELDNTLKVCQESWADMTHVEKAQKATAYTTRTRAVLCMTASYAHSVAIAELAHAQNELQRDRCDRNLMLLAKTRIAMEGAEYKSALPDSKKSPDFVKRLKRAAEAKQQHLNVCKLIADPSCKPNVTIEEPNA
ncbi:hypothetical protein OAM67_00830 [bacterium]|nr:hypothetical protein [bacterium]